MYTCHVEVCLRYLIPYLYQEYGTVILVIIEAPIQYGSRFPTRLACGCSKKHRASGVGGPLSVPASVSAFRAGQKLLIYALQASDLGASVLLFGVLTSGILLFCWGSRSFHLGRWPVVKIMVLFWVPEILGAVFY